MVKHTYLVYEVIDFRFYDSWNLLYFEIYFVVNT